MQNQDANPGGSDRRRENPFQPVSRDYGIVPPPGTSAGNGQQQQEDFYSRPPADMDRYSRSQERDPYSSSTSRFEESRNNPYQSNIRPPQELNYLEESSYLGSNRIPNRDPYPTQ